LKRLFAGLLTLAMIAGLAGQPGTANAATPFPTLNFDNGVIPSYVTGSNATLQIVTNTTGSKALKVNYAVADFPSVKFAPATPWSVGSGNAIAFELTNVSNKDITFYLRVDDSAQADGVKDSIVSQAVAKAGTTNQYFLSLNSAVLDLGMRFLPPNPAGLQMGYAWGDKSINPANVVSLQFFQMYPSTATALVIDNLRVIQDPNSNLSYLNGIVDKYGQYSGASWSEKINSDQDLLNDKAVHSPLLQANTEGGRTVPSCKRQVDSGLLNMVASGHWLILKGTYSSRLVWTSSAWMICTPGSRDGMRCSRTFRPKTAHSASTSVIQRQ
jgi:hypothetical protein